MVYAICDDQEKQALILKEDLQKYMDKSDEIILFLNENLLLEYMGIKKIDVLFLDILLGHASGIDVAMEVNKLSPCTQIIFISSYAGDFLEDVYTTEHIGFLRKPINGEKLNMVLDKARAGALNNALPLPVAGKTILVSPPQISYIEAKGHEAEVYYCNGRTVRVKCRLSEIEKKLPENVFVRCHRSFIINIKHITCYTSSFISVNGYTNPVSAGRKYKEKVFERLSRYWGNM